MCFEISFWREMVENDLSGQFCANSAGVKTERINCKRERGIDVKSRKWLHKTLGLWFSSWRMSCD